MGEGEIVLGKGGGSGVISEGVVEGWVISWGGGVEKGRYPVMCVLDCGEDFECVWGGWPGPYCRVDMSPYRRGGMVVLGEGRLPLFQWSL